MSFSSHHPLPVPVPVPLPVSRDIPRVSIFSQDGQVFDLISALFHCSLFFQTLHFNEENFVTKEIHLPLSTKCLVWVVTFAEHYFMETMVEIPKPLTSTNMNEMVQTWYANYVNSLDSDTLYELLFASNYLQINPLHDLICATLASKIKEESEEVRSHFLIDEESRARAENKWCEEV